MTKLESGTSMMNIDAGDTAWVLAAACLVMLMTPALGFFYGGLVRHKNILTLLIQCYAIFAAVSIIWALLGYSLTFGESSGHFIGDSHYFALRNIGMEPYIEAPTIPGMVFFFFQLCACAITPALIVGAPAERFGLIPAVLFSCVWVIMVYCPIGHWVFHEHGWLKELGAKDFAGGMVVHMSAGYSALAMAFLSGKRKESNGVPAPHNISYSILGAALLWFGWFGYNGGGAFAANLQAGLAIVSTNLAASTGGLGWAMIDYAYTRKVSPLGIATGSVCGLIAMTCGCGFCPAWSSLLIGLIGGVLSSLFCKLREHYHLFDDSLDVFGCHGVCGTWGVFATGLWASADTPGNTNGAFYGRGILLGYQLAGIVTVALYSFALTLVIGTAMKYAGILRVSEEEEEKGLDMVLYGEQAYVFVPDIPRNPTI